MRVSVIKREHLTQGMIVAEDVYSNGNQLVLSHGMVLTSGVIGRLQRNDVDVGAVKVCSDSVEQQGDYHFVPAYSTRVTSSKEYRDFNRIYRDLALKFEEYVYYILRHGSFPDEVPLLEGIRKLEGAATGSVHMLELLLNRPGEETLFISHSINVALLAYGTAKLLNLTEEEKDVIILSGFFHDIGRVATPDMLVRKPDYEEYRAYLEQMNLYQVMKDHVVFGYHLLKNHKFDERICNCALYHHERMDGNGYLVEPDESRMDFYTNLIAITDMADLVMLANFRGSRNNIFRAVEMFLELGWMKYDKKLLHYCMRRLAELYLHHIVELSNGIQGEIAGINKHCLSRPLIKTQYGFIDLSKTDQLDISRIY